VPLASQSTTLPVLAWVQSRRICASTSRTCQSQLHQPCPLLHGSLHDQRVSVRIPAIRPTRARQGLTARDHDQGRALLLVKNKYHPSLLDQNVAEHALAIVVTATRDHAHDRGHLLASLPQDLRAMHGEGRLRGLYHIHDLARLLGGDRLTDVVVLYRVLDRAHRRPDHVEEDVLRLDLSRAPLPRLPAADQQEQLPHHSVSTIEGEGTRQVRDHGALASHHIMVRMVLEEGAEPAHRGSHRCGRKGA